MSKVKRFRVEGIFTDESGHRAALARIVPGPDRLEVAMRMHDDYADLENLTVTEVKERA